MKYKVGDRVIIRQGNTKDIGKSKMITLIENITIGNRVHIIYRLNNDQILYYHEGFIELDVCGMRDDKIREILEDEK